MYDFINKFSLRMLEKYPNNKFYDKLFTWSFYKQYGISRYEAIDEHDAYLDREESKNA